MSTPLGQASGAAGDPADAEIEIAIAGLRQLRGRLEHICKVAETCPGALEASLDCQMGREGLARTQRHVDLLVPELRRCVEAGDAARKVLQAVLRHSPRTSIQT